MFIVFHSELNHCSSSFFNRDAIANQIKCSNFAHELIQRVILKLSQLIGY